MDNQALKVLLVDDEVSVGDLLTNCVDWECPAENIGGEAVGTGEAVAMVDRLLPDLVLTDLGAPAVDRIEAIRGKYPFKVVIITDYEDFDLTQRSIRAGITEYLSKPINDTEITRIILKIIDNLLELESYFTKFPRQMVSSGNQMRHKKVNKVIREIQEYLLKNYADSALSQATVAKHFYLNPSYLSRIFKQAINQTFIEYLTRIRMEKAKQLLKETDLRAYEIAERVGIDDPHYFGICFKKYTGMSVNDYKKALLL